MAEKPSDDTSNQEQAPWPGNHQMPRWNTGELVDAPKFGWKNWALMLGPGLVMGGSAIGGGEWLVGPMVTAKFGGSLLWLATISIMGQVVYNLEISRYTLYTGEPIFTGKFRMLPNPMFWVCVYLILDFGSIFPYLAASAATPLATVILGKVPDANDGVAVFQLFGNEMSITHKTLLRVLSYFVFVGALLPLIFGGKIFNALKVVMSFKIFTVLGFLLVLGIFYTHVSTWTEIFGGFFEFGNVPIRQVEDSNGNGILDPGEDWDGDGHSDVLEASLERKTDLDGDGEPDATDINEDRQPDPMVKVERNGKLVYWPDLNQDGQADENVAIDTDGDGQPDQSFPVDADQDGKLDTFIDVDGDGTRDGDAIDNVFVAAFEGRPMPTIDWSTIAFLSALVAISGSGGLSNAPISNYTRDQGWGMGHLVGAIPSVVGGQNIQLSHVGTVFKPDKESLPRWKRWYRHVLRDQLVVWMPACFLGLALPSMLSVEFLPRGTVVGDRWVAASMTANGVRDRVGGDLGEFFWFMTLFCGFLVLAPSMATSADGVIRRWVDAFWTSSKSLRKVDPKNIRYVYFGVLFVWSILAFILLSLETPQTLLLIATTIFNFALGFSCWHTLWVNSVLLPKPLRPNWFLRIALFLAGVFFWVVASIAAAQKLGWI